MIRLASLTFAAILALAACGSAESSTLGKDTVADCFEPAPSTAPSTSLARERESDSETAALAALRRYMAQVPASSGDVVALSQGRFALGFTDNGCAHRAAAAQAADIDEARLSAFKIEHSASQIAAVHGKLTRAKAAHHLDGFGIVQWGPTIYGYEEVVTTDSSRSRDLLAYLASNFADGDATFFRVVEAESAPTEY